MGGKFQSFVVSALSGLAAIFLLVAIAYEISRGETGMAVLIFPGVLCAGALSWHTRKPYNPRIRFKAYPKARYPVARNRVHVRD
jgi:hypothetical protein